MWLAGLPEGNGDSRAWELQESPAPSGNARKGRDGGDEQHKGSCKA